MEFHDGQDVIESFEPDLDSNPPLILEAKTKGTDFSFTRAVYQDGISFGTYGGSKTIAPLPSGGTDPSEEECRTHLAENATSSGGTLEQGDGFCVKTTEGRTAYIRVIDSPSGLGTLRLKVTVWELPS
ncbi:hypothetical protein [Streptomyces bullii]|uniref:Uncharacterized protein n=1 Tax=Streptomyces bullii TaxID=349910 RepID=A0ABW0UMR4_9ACTN